MSIRSSLVWGRDQIQLFLSTSVDIWTNNVENVNVWINNVKSVTVWTNNAENAFVSSKKC